MQEFKSFKEFILDNYTEEERYEIAHNGCEGGINGMIYYNETTDIYNQYCDDLHAIIDEQIEISGSSPDYIIKHLGNAKLFKNAVVWYCAEVTAWETLQAEEIA